MNALICLECFESFSLSERGNEFRQSSIQITQNLFFY